MRRAKAMRDMIAAKRKRLFVVMSLMEEAPIVKRREEMIKMVNAIAMAVLRRGFMGRTSSILGLLL